jgi:hypothetical protein
MNGTEDLLSNKNTGFLGGGGGGSININRNKPLGLTALFLLVGVDGSGRRTAGREEVQHDPVQHHVSES